MLFFCKNNHFDALTHAAEVAVINRLNKQKWMHSLVESDQFITGDTTPKEEINLFVNTLSRQSINNICFSDMTIIRLKFNNTFISHDFDVKNEERDELLNEIDLCPKLDRLHSSIIDSEFFGIGENNFLKISHQT